MGKYKQWLHHQEIGRRLRDQINTLEQERARVQKMAPANPTSLPDLENPMIAALLSYTRAGNKLSNIDVIKAAMPKIDPALEQRRPAPNGASGANGAAPAQSVVAGLQARAASIPADPLEQMRDLSRGASSSATPPSPAQSRPASNPGTAGSNPGSNPGSKPDSVGGWWQRQRSED